jgi:outer membrane receptor protein involved in Fe transport
MSNRLLKTESSVAVKFDNMTTTDFAPGHFLFLLLVPCLAGAQTAIEEIKVVASTPLGESLASELASNVQTIDADEFRQQRALDLTELMNRNLGSVFINEAQSNPLQPDVQYRGFVGSPLLGLPQGIAVYQNGVRVNEPFGDTVNWALIPNDAIDKLHLMPGSDPMFGLNALGGAISIKTKDGFSNAGARGTVTVGSFSRLGVKAEAGDAINESIAYFVSAAYLEEDGWRDFSGTRALQTFGSIKWRTDSTTIDTRLTYVDTSLTGNGAAPVQLLAIDRSAIFTHPDDTENELVMLDAGLNHTVSDALSLAANVYVRDSDIETLNGDDSDYEECPGAPVMCHEDGPLLGLNGNPIPADDSVEGAVINRTTTGQDGMGASMQVDFRSKIGGNDNRFVAGLSYDRSDVEFSSSTELGTLDASRGALPGGVIAASSLTRLSTDTQNGSLFFSNLLSLGEKFTVGFAGRFNHTETRLQDRLGTALTGNHKFDRFNPSASLTWQHNAYQLYARYSESSRVPSPVELTCADEDAPCRLPNAFLSDPPLNMIVANTWEGGIRGSSEKLNWHAGLFRTLAKDDIIFISAGALTNRGYFDNVSRTRRVGLELNLNGDVSPSLRWFLNYTHLDATFDDSFVMSSPNNPESVNGEIQVSKGDRIPLIPQHLFKGGVTWSPGDRVSLGVDVHANSDSYLRGDEGNDTRPVDGYAVLNANATLHINDHLQVFLNLANLLNSNYESFGLFGEADEVLGSEFDNSRFLSPGAPRAAWFGFELSR